MKQLALAIIACGSLAFAPAALADSIVFERGGNIWQAQPDGSDQRQITTAGGYTKPSQADDGTVVAEKDNILHRMDRAGRVLNTAGSSEWGGPINTSMAPGGGLVAYTYFLSGGLSPGTHTAISHSSRETARGEIFDIQGWGNPAWIDNNRLLMFPTSGSDDTLIKTLGVSGTQTWFDDPDLALRGGEINPAATRLAATDSAKLRIYALSGPPPALPTGEACDLINPTGSFFRPTWAPDNVRLAWQEDDGIWVGNPDPSCAGGAALMIPGGQAPDWGPAEVSTPAASPAPPAIDKAAPRVTTRMVRRARRRALLRGLTVKVNCNEPCRITAELLIDRRIARRLRLAATTRIGRATKRTTRAGTVSVKVRPTAKARRRLGRARVRSVSVRVRASDAAGNRSRWVTKRVAIRG